MKAAILAALLTLGVLGGAITAQAASPTPEVSEDVTTDQSSSSSKNPAPVIRWVEFRGTVSQVDLARRVFQIEEITTRKPIEIPVSPEIKIFDYKKREWLLGDLRRGQKIIVRNELYNRPLPQ